MNSRTHIGDLSYTWDSNKIKTSESITGVVSGYGFTSAGTTAGNEDLCFSPSLPPPASSLLIDIDANGTADVNFQYDALGRRVARSGAGGSVVYVQMDQQTIADYPVGGAATTPTFRYVYASYIDEPVVRKTAGTGGTMVYFHRNHQYSITAVTTSTGSIAERYAYSAYGQPTILDASASVLSNSAINNRYTYTGREWDATLGLHHFRARWMSPSAGRFLGRDPIGYEGSEWGLYEFLESNSFGNLDPSGKSCLCGEVITCAAKCGPIACLMGGTYIDLAMRRSMREAQEDWEGHNDKIDAYRHCLWSCYIASSGVGEESAFCVTQVHEECAKDQPVEEYCMDFWNNAKGREASRGVPVVSCDTACWNMLQNGELQTVNRCPSKSDKDRRRRRIVNATRE